MADGLKIDIDTQKLLNSLDDFEQRLRYGLLMYASTEAENLEAEMKAKRPWTDRSGDAKKYLTARASLPSKNEIEIKLAHGVRYGIWLELANEKKYAIVAPTAKLRGPGVIEGLKGIMNSI